MLTIMELKTHKETINNEEEIVNRQKLQIIDYWIKTIKIKLFKIIENIRTTFIKTEWVNLKIYQIKLLERENQSLK